MKKYVLGLMFSVDLKQVLLINKKKPDWQRGKFNGIGGALYPGENSDTAMRREFKEETGIGTEARYWSFFCTFYGDDWAVDCYCVSSFFIEEAKTQTPAVDELPEEVGAFDVDHLPDNHVPVLNWLVPMALGFLKGQENSFAYLVQCVRN